MANQMDIKINGLQDQQHVLDEGSAHPIARTSRRWGGVPTSKLSRRPIPRCCTGVALLHCVHITRSVSGSPPPSGIQGTCSRRCPVASRSCGFWSGVCVAEHCQPTSRAATKGHALRVGSEGGATQKADYSSSNMQAKPINLYMPHVHTRRRTSQIRI